jgi:hypothetical protein
MEYRLCGKSPSTCAVDHRFRYVTREDLAIWADRLSKIPGQTSRPAAGLKNAVSGLYIPATKRLFELLPLGGGKRGHETLVRAFVEIPCDFVIVRDVVVCRHQCILRYSKKRFRVVK